MSPNCLCGDCAEAGGRPGGGVNVSAGTSTSVSCTIVVPSAGGASTAGEELLEFCDEELSDDSEGFPDFGVTAAITGIGLKGDHKPSEACAPHDWFGKAGSVLATEASWTCRRISA